MMTRCPCCKARLRESEQCPRCKADLSLIIGSEQFARLWFSKAIHYWLENKTEQSITALECSLGQKESKIAVVFRYYIVQKKCQYILELLAQKQLLSAKNQLYSVRRLFPHSNQLQQLNVFTDYLLRKEA
jgi:hypothetical protein